MRGFAHLVADAADSAQHAKQLRERLQALLPHSVPSFGTVLAAAAAANDAELLTLLLLIAEARDQQVRDSDDSGHTPLMAAAANGHASTASVLLKYNAQQQALPEAVRLAVQGGHADVARLILRLTSTAELQRLLSVQLVNVLLRPPANPARVLWDDLGEGRTLLHMAVAGACVDAVRALLERAQQQPLVKRDQDGDSVLLLVRRRLQDPVLEDDSRCPYPAPLDLL